MWYVFFSVWPSVDQSLSIGKGARPDCQIERWEPIPWSEDSELRFLRLSGFLGCLFSRDGCLWRYQMDIHPPNRSALKLHCQRGGREHCVQVESKRESTAVFLIEREKEEG